MWMMGYNDGGEFNMTDAFGSRKLRPLMPRPASAAAAAVAASAPPNPPPSFSRFHGADFVSLNHHLVSAAMAEQNKRDFNTQQVVVSSRWNPTPEQLQTLEELYQRGTRTPSAEQIQHITAQLRRYGKIEGKNVFYWFQNHKARERQKRRRQLESAPDDNPRIPENIERKESGGGSRTGFQVEHNTKNWPTSTNCTTFPEKNVLKQRAAEAAAAAKAAGAECRGADGWVHFDEGDNLQQQQRRNCFMERNDTWQMMQLSCSSSPTNLINSTTVATSTTSMTLTTTLLDKPKFIKQPPPHHQDLNIFMSPFRDDPDRLIHVGHQPDQLRYEESQTLQLFPLTSGDGHEDNSEKETQESPASMNTTNSNPYPFFEFLPLKN